MNKKEIKNPDTDLLRRSMQLKECPHGVVRASELIFEQKVTQIVMTIRIVQLQT